LAPIPNPEHEWERATAIASVDRAEVEARLGPTSASLELLSGGQANLNVRVGADRVLRIYRRDPRVRAKEQALLARGWETFAAPAILDAGDDFLVLAYVPHGPLDASDAHGVWVGRALAEIHRTRYDGAGLLGPDLTLTESFGDIADVFRAHARTELSRAAWLDERLVADVDARLAAHADIFRRESQAPVLLHGDFKASNLHRTQDDRLLVLDWEFAYAGPALLDVGQLLRWSPSPAFVDAFADSYQQHGGLLQRDWRHTAATFDLVNLAGLAAGARAGSRRAIDIRERIDRC
jgi:fructosamine-3-kinase